jgi:hypothetical protein
MPEEKARVIMSKKISSLVLVVILVSLAIIPLVSAENVTPVTTPFITIDPIGNHTVGDVFFINGTTNLPVNDSLGLWIFQYDVLCELHHDREHDVGTVWLGNEASRKIENIPIIPDNLGSNRFSINVTDNTKSLTWEGGYIVWVYSGEITRLMLQK